MLNKTVVIALGGNAIKQRDEQGTAEEQFRNIKKTCRHILEMVKKGYRIVLTHGNGPQAGNLIIQQERTQSHIPSQPLDIVGAMTQGQIGYMLQQALINYIKEEGLNIPVTTIITQVLVDKNDPDFQNPSKPIGPFYTEKEAKVLKERARALGYLIKEVIPQRFRRVTPSPKPVKIVEEEVIVKLKNEGFLVIASGGGGIPVILNEDGQLEGVEAVIDKDLAAEKLAETVNADELLILTDVEKVKLNYGKPDEKVLDRMSLKEAKKYLKEGHFLRGSMEPKILACVQFLESGGEKAMISSLHEAIETLEGKAGTLIYRD